MDIMITSFEVVSDNKPASLIFFGWNASRSYTFQPTSIDFEETVSAFL